jgi:hypothetical protein
MYLLPPRLLHTSFNNNKNKTQNQTISNQVSGALTSPDTQYNGNPSEQATTGDRRIAITTVSAP